MRYESIADIYTANERIRREFADAAASITPEEAGTLADGEKWTPAHLVEHVAMVTGGVAQICSRLAGKAKTKGGTSDGRFELSPGLVQQFAGSAAAKLEAPDIVKPGGGVTVEESMARLAAADEAFAALRTDLETIDASGEKFPHPYFGPLNAGEWLILAGLHESRHTRQLACLLANIRKQ